MVVMVAVLQLDRGLPVDGQVPGSRLLARPDGDRAAEDVLPLSCGVACRRLCWRLCGLVGPAAGVVVGRAAAVQQAHAQCAAFAPRGRQAVLIMPLALLLGSGVARTMAATEAGWRPIRRPMA